jgi:hypothetical protein
MLWADWFTVTGVPLTALGVVLTYREAARARTASEAVLEAEREIAIKQTLIVVSRLHRLAEQLDDAVMGRDASWTNRVLTAWRVEAGYLLGLLSLHEGLSTELSKRLSRSAQLAGVASLALVDRSTGGSFPIPAKARQAIQEACQQLATWSGTSAGRVDVAQIERGGAG